MYLMEYEDEGGSPGSVPEFGAIFMANCARKKEFFRRKLLGLPLAQANFVKRIKAGMILFLFEFEKRELYGVYQASSDGAMNIVPHAFDSSQRQFPAQVRFTVIWYCEPLSEHEFRDAISENYYSNKKFSFGLSEDQVRRLLYLFSSRKSETRVPQRQFGGVTSLTGKKRVFRNEKVDETNRLKSVEEDTPAHTIYTDYSGGSPSDIQRPDNKSFAEHSPGYDTLTEHEGIAMGRRKGVAENSMDLNLMQDKLGFNYDDRSGYSHPVGLGDLRESLYNSRRLGNVNQPLYRDTVKTEDIRDALTHMNPGDFLTRARRELHDGIGQMRDTRGDKHSQSDYGFQLSKQVETFEIPQTEMKRPNYNQRLFMNQVDYDHSSAGGPKLFISKNQSNETFFGRARRDLNDGRVRMRDMRGDKHTPSEDGFRLGKGTEGFEIPLTELRRPIDDQSLFMDCKVDYDHNSFGGPNPIFMNRVSNSLAKVRRVPDDYEQICIGRSMDNDITPIVSDRPDKARRVTDDDRRQIPTEQLSSRLGYGGKFNYQESSNNVDNSLGLVTSAVHSGHPLDRSKQLDNKNILLKNDGIDNAYTLGNNAVLPLSAGYDDVYQPGQQASFNSSKPTLEAHYFLTQNQHKASIFPSSVEERMYGTSFAMEKNKYGVSYPTSPDSALPRSMPYNPDFPEVSGTSHSVKDFVPHHSCFGNNFNVSIKPSPNCTVTKDLISLTDGSLRRVSEVPMHDNQDPYEHYDPRVSESLLCGGYREKMENSSITDENYEDLLPFLRNSIYDMQNMSPFIEFNEYFLAEEGMVPETVIGPAYSDIQDLLVKYGMGRVHLESSFEKINDSYIGPYQDPDAMSADSENRRTSVFARLSTPSKNRGQEKKGYMEQNALDPSVDQVMDTVYECLSQKITKANKYSQLNKRHNKEGILGAKRQEKRFNQKQDDESTIDDKPTMMAQKMVNEGKLATIDEKNAGDVLTETRVVEFKRRSEANKRQNVGKSTGSAQKPEGKSEGEEEGKPLKRRKLIRPVFGKKEELNDDSKGDVLSDSLSTCSKNKDVSCEFSRPRVRNPKCRSPNSQIYKKSIGPVSSEKDELNKHSNLQISSKSKDASCDFSGTSLENPNSLSPNSREKLVRPSFSQKESNDDSKRDGMSDLHLLSTHDSSNKQKAATREFSDENLGYLNSASPNSGSLESKAPTGSGERGVIATNPKL